MNEESIQVARIESGNANSSQIIPMKIGSATVYIRQIGESDIIEPDDKIFPVSLPSPNDAFQLALEAIKETVAGLGSKLDELKEKMRPDKLVIEFSIGFELKGKVNIIPILISSEGNINSGLKITAEWHLSKNDKT